MVTGGFAVMAIAALLAGAALQLVLALAGYRARRQERSQAAVIRDLQKEVVGLQRELTSLRTRLAGGERRPPPPAAMAATEAPAVRREPSSPAYELAGRLARRGASGSELMETCGLSRGEVDLITRLSRLGDQARQKAETLRV
ncbi:MAG: DUF2802 domain-containing protein [Chromatiales bacterium]|nr:DUF2802 domain-containing protein [Chromatiales bacterium]